MIPRLVAVGILAGTGDLALGAPDWRGAVNFLGGGQPTGGGALAVAVIVVWILIVATVVTLLLPLRRARLSRLFGSASARAVLCLAAGTAVLIAGALHHASAGYSMCCGDTPRHLQEARDLIR